MLAVLFGCGLRRSELVALEMNDVQMRQGHLAVVDLIGKGGHIRTVPIPIWVKAALDDWKAAARISEGRIFRAVARTDKVWGDGISQNVVSYVVKGCCQKAGLEHIAPHDLRRTCAKLCHTSGGEIELIQFLLGHASVQTTERYLGCKQNLGHPVNDLFKLGNIAVAVQASFCREPEVLTAKTRCGQPDKISGDERSGVQKGSDARAGTRFQGDGSASV
jgi:integrase